LFWIFQNIPEFLRKCKYDGTLPSDSTSAPQYRRLPFAAVNRQRGHSLELPAGRQAGAVVNVSIVCAGEYVGLEEIDDGIWNVCFGPLKLGRLHERHMRIEDE
jgi:hypothetical protein